MTHVKMVQIIATFVVLRNRLSRNPLPRNQLTRNHITRNHISRNRILQTNDLIHRRQVKYGSKHFFGIVNIL